MPIQPNELEKRPRLPDRVPAQILVDDDPDIRQWLFDRLKAGGYQPEAVTNAREAIAAAQRGNVSIYAIDPRGLATGTSDAIEIDGVPGSSVDNGDGTTSAPPTNIGLQSLMK